MSACNPIDTTPFTTMTAVDCKQQKIQTQKKMNCCGIVTEGRIHSPTPHCPPWLTTSIPSGPTFTYLPGGTGCMQLPHGRQAASAPPYHRGCRHNPAHSTI
eukprot:124434-Amphidinium_carterae.1